MNSLNSTGRRLTLDPDKSYRTPMRRTADTPIELVRSAPTDPYANALDPDLAKKIAMIEAEERKTKMICPACGAVSTDMRLTCHNCGVYFDGHTGSSDVRVAALASTGGLSLEEQEKLARRSYLSRRALAKLVDVSIVAAFIAFQYIVYFAVARSLIAFPSAAYLAFNFFFWGMPVLSVLTILSYNAWFESSQVQATPGKLMFGLYAEDLNGQLLRSPALVGKSLLAALPLFAAVAVYAFFYNVRLQYGLSLDANSASVLALTAFTCLVTSLTMHIFVGKEDSRRTVLDVIAGMRVCERK